MESGVQALQVTRRQLVDWPGCIRRPIQRGVVDDDHVSVAGEVHVAFQAVSAELDRVVERRERVFRPELRTAPMGDRDEPGESEKRLDQR
jgi:hypothetical protein